MSGGGAKDRLQVGDAVPAFLLPDLSGEPVSITWADAAATVLVTTSRGCPYALAWQDRINDIGRDFADRRVRLVQLLVNDSGLQPADDPSVALSDVHSGKVAGIVLHDSDQQVAATLGATATPEVFVVDQAGILRYHGAPDGNYDQPDLAGRWVRQALVAVLAGEGVDPAQTSAAGCSIKWRVDLLWSDDCPSRHAAGQLLRAALEDLGRADVAVREVQIRTVDQAQERSFAGSPTYQVGGLDLFPSDAQPGVGCRIYRLPDGRSGPLPTKDQLVAVLKERLARPWDLPGWSDFRSQHSGG